jgi:hypothetical protein
MQLNQLIRRSNTSGRNEVPLKPVPCNDISLQDLLGQAARTIYRAIPTENPKRPDPAAARSSGRKLAQKDGLWKVHHLAGRQTGGI